MFLENKIYLDTSSVDDRISRAIDNDHTAAMKAPVDSKKFMKKNGRDFNGSSEIAMCLLCKKAFKTHLLYRKHMRLHSDKSHQCQLCGKVFNKRHYLQVHMQSHSKHQYQCHLCHKRFSVKGNLNQHLKFHQNKKTFKCHICEKDFYQQEHLKTHLRHHNNERPFECELCQKSFNIKSSLQRHMNCHTGEKPFICDICNRGYTRRSVLMLHIQQVHENKKPFQCDECSLCFSQKGNLQAHFRRKHLQAKSEGKRRDKDKGKRGNRKKSYYDEPPVKTHNKSMADSTLHSYASKVKAIVSRGARTQQKLNKPLSVFSFKNLKEPSVETDSSTLSDEAVDVGCSSSSSGEDIQDLNFPGMLEGESEDNYDIKSISDFETLLDEDKAWESYLISDSDILSSSLPHYDMNDVFSSSMSKSNAVQSKDGSEELFSNLVWSEDCETSPLFTAEDLDEIKDISSICGIKMELADGERIRNYPNPKSVKNSR